MILHVDYPLHTGVTLHCVTHGAASSPPRGTLLLIHGFPDTSYGWRRLMRPLSAAGYNVVAPDMRGYGSTRFTNPSHHWIHSDFSQQAVVADVMALLDVLLLDKAILVGHDWGGTVVWNCLTHHPERVLAVASFCTPFFPPAKENPLPKLLANSGRFAYQVYFQSERAIAELDRDVDFTVRCMLRSATDEEQADLASLADPLGRGGLLVGTSPTLGRSKAVLRSDAELRVYAQQFRTSSFRGGVYWYRNVEDNWRYNLAQPAPPGGKYTTPALMVCAELDHVLRPSMAAGMSAFFSNLEMRTIRDAGHWLLQEKSDECATVLVGWLGGLDAARPRL